jgi:putative heme-binding domain-containing protein
MRGFVLLSFLLSLSASARDIFPVRAASLRVTGSPKLGKPYVDARVFPQLSFANALDLVPLPGGKRWVIVERTGKIWSFSNDNATSEKQLFADLKAMHPETDNVYGVQFHPRFAKNGLVFITYTKGAGLEEGSVLAKFKVVDRGGHPEVDPASEVPLLHWRSGGHNGAAMQFGLDGFLYLSTGDSEVPSPPDPLSTGQDLDDLLSCILRIDVDRAEGGKPYAVPGDNPFVSTPGARPEIWAIGLRNPWKIAFDRATGRLWCGDVGWELWEMIHLIQRGGNYGWSAMEASQPIKPQTRAKLPISPPTVAHPHSEAASITGGFVYSGTALPGLRGAYVYADYETGRIWALWHDGKAITRHEEICDTAHKIVTFGQDEAGEILYVHYAEESTLHQLVANPEAGKASAFPRKLSETGLFTDAKTQAPASGVLKYAIAAPAWADGATAEQWVALPPQAAAVKSQVRVNKEGKVNGTTTWPKDAVLAKTLSYDKERVETQLLHFDGHAWQGYSYKWRDDQTDAEIVPAEGAVAVLKGKTHRFHSRSECMRCHTSWTQYTIGFQPQQLKNAQTLIDAAIVETNFQEQSPARLVNPHDPEQSLHDRSRAWLHANCAHCHRENGGGSVAVQLNAELVLAGTKTLGQRPQRGTFGIPEGRIIAPSSPGHSVLLHRLAVTGAGHMPIIGAQEVDVAGLRLLSEWISTVPSSDGFPADLGGATDSAAKQWIAMTLSAQPDLDESFHVLLSDSPATAFRLLNYIDDPKTPPQVLSYTLERTKSSPSGQVRALYERFLPPGEREVTLGANPDVAALLALPGDAKRGAELFSPTGKAATCLSCHFVQGQGRDFGPDLSQVGTRLTKAQLLESLLAPSKVLSPGYSTTLITLKDSTVHTGFILSESEKELTLKLATTQSLVLPKAQIQQQQILPTSLMPEGLLQSLTAQEAADLLEYLASRK